MQAQASVYIFMIAAVLWVLRFAMSSTWLYWLAIWFKPILEALRQLLVDLHVFPICLALGIAVGGFHIVWHGRRGRGAAIMLSAFAIGMFGLWLTRDPLGELYSDDGLLNQARTLGFQSRPGGGEQRPDRQRRPHRPAQPPDRRPGRRAAACTSADLELRHDGRLASAAAGRTGPRRS